jgi:alkylhydroperoxidase/carboxymuconolactone decarboxylase family protein YurZ
MRAYAAEEIMGIDSFDAELRAAWNYARDYYQDERALASFEVLARHNPRAFVGYMTLRQGVFKAPPAGSLPLATKELIILAIECALKKTNPPPLVHARRAIAAGATVAEIAEVVSISIMIAGMLTYQESGRFVLEEAERLVGTQSPDVSSPAGDG